MYQSDLRLYFNTFHLVYVPDVFCTRNGNNNNWMTFIIRSFHLIGLIVRYTANRYVAYKHLTTQTEITHARHIGHITHHFLTLLLCYNYTVAFTVCQWWASNNVYLRSIYYHTQTFHNSTHQCYANCVNLVAVYCTSPSSERAVQCGVHLTGCWLLAHRICCHFGLPQETRRWQTDTPQTSLHSVLGKLLFKSNLSMSTITWLEK